MRHLFRIESFCITIQKNRVENASCIRKVYLLSSSVTANINKVVAFLYGPYSEFSYAHSEELIQKLLTSLFRAQK